MSNNVTRSTNSEVRRERRRRTPYGRDDVATYKCPASRSRAETVQLEAERFNASMGQFAPVEAHKSRWHFLVFRGEDEAEQPMVPLHEASTLTIGRDRHVADIAASHGTCSRKHAMYLNVLGDYMRQDGSIGKTVRPHLVDLNSTYGTYVNGERITPGTPVPLQDYDCVRFGKSSLDYMVSHQSASSSEDEASE